MATNKRRSGGLGADAIFGTDQPPTTAAETPKAEKPTPSPPKVETMRTTIMLPADVVVLLSRMKEQSILDGNRQTQGEIIAEALRALAETRGIKT